MSTYERNNENKVLSQSENIFQKGKKINSFCAKVSRGFIELSIPSRDSDNIGERLESFRAAW